MTAFHSSIVAIAVFLLTVGFGAFAAFTFPYTFAAHLLAESGQSFGVHLYVGAVGALAFLAAKELVAEAVAVEFEALGLLAVALELAFVLLGSGLRSLYGDKGIVLEYILKAIVFGELYGVELSKFYLTSLPFPHQVCEDILPLLWLVTQEHQLTLLTDLIGDSFGVRRNTQLTYIHSLYKFITRSCYMARKIIPQSAQRNAQHTL